MPPSELEKIPTPEEQTTQFVEFLSEVPQKEDAKYQKERASLKRYEQDTRSRKALTTWSSWVVSIYLAAIIGTLILNKPLGFELDNTVLVTLLGTTTLNVLGLMYIVLNGYFPKDREE